MPKINKQRGFTLIETLIYIVGFVLLVSAISTLLFNMYRWYDQVTIVSRTDQAGVTLVDHIVRDLRSGQSINIASSTFDVAIGSISIVSRASAATTTKYYMVQNGRIIYSENGGATSYVSPADSSVTKLLFKQINTPISTAIHIELELTYMLHGATTSRSYSDIAVMRNTY
jgi:type II secretory pathway pseudopilin PulG